MAKRQRPRASSRSSGHRGTRPGVRPAAAPSRTGGLSQTEEARAAEIESQIVAREQAVVAERGRARERRRTEGVPRDEVEPRPRGGASLLAIRGEQEYTYVVRDVRRIITVGGSLVGVLLILFLVIEVFGIIHI